MTDRIEVKDICTHRSCEGKGTYRMIGSCANCKTDNIIGEFTKGHEAKNGWSSPNCPICGCSNHLYWRKLADDIAQSGYTIDSVPALRLQMWPPPWWQ